MDLNNSNKMYQIAVGTNPEGEQELIYTVTEKVDSAFVEQNLQAMGLSEAEIQDLLSKSNIFYRQTTPGQSDTYSWSQTDTVQQFWPLVEGQTIARLRVDKIQLHNSDGTITEETAVNFLVESPAAKDEVIVAAVDLMTDEQRAEFEAAMALITPDTVFTRTVFGSNISYSWYEPAAVKLYQLGIFGTDVNFSITVRVSQDLAPHNEQGQIAQTTIYAPSSVEDPISTPVAKEPALTQSVESLTGKIRGRAQQFWQDLQAAYHQLAESWDNTKKKKNSSHLK
jgi:hypothetical protein